MIKHIFKNGYTSLLGVIAISEVSSTLIVPILAFLFFSNDSSLFHITASHATRARFYGYALAVGKVGAILSSVLLGMAMDKFGRRIVMLLSCAGLAAAMLLFVESIDKGMLWLFIIGMLCMNFLYAGKQSGLAMIGDMPDKENKVLRMSWFQAAIAIGALLGPFMAGIITEHHLLSPDRHYVGAFWVGFCFAIIALLIVLFFVSETMNSDVKVHINFSSYWKLFTEKPILKLFLQVIMIQWTWSLYYEYSPAVVKTVFNFSPKEVGFFMAFVAFWLIVASLVFLPFLKARMTLPKLKKFSASLLLIGILISMVSTALPSTVLGSSLYWLSPAFTASGDVMFYALIVSEFSNIVPGSAQGKIMGLIYIVLTATWAVSAFVGGHVMAFYVGSTMWLAVIGVIVWLLKSRKYLGLE